MSFTSLSSLWSTFVTLTCSTSSFLWCWLGTRSSSISQSLGPLPNVLASVLKVLMYTVYYISPQDLIEIFMVQCGDLTCELTSDEVEYRYIQVSIHLEWLRRPWLLNKSFAIASFQFVFIWIEVFLFNLSER